MVRFSSRKFVIIVAQNVILILLPMIYKRLEISDDILLTVMGASSALVGLYTGVNVLDAKKNG